MAQIGSFTRGENGVYTGEIRTLTLRVKASIRPCERDNGKSPDHRVSAGGVEFGAARAMTASTSSSGRAEPDAPRATARGARAVSRICHSSRETLQAGASACVSLQSRGTDNPLPPGTTHTALPGDGEPRALRRAGFSREIAGVCRNCGSRFRHSATGVPPAIPGVSDGRSPSLSDMDRHNGHRR